MKPRDSAPLTREDRLIWGAVEQRFWEQPGHGLLIPLQLVQRSCDRRDADLMLWMTNMSIKHYAAMPDLPANRWIPLAQIVVKCDPEWPVGHHVIDMT